MDARTLYPLYNRLEQLTIINTHLKEFPFHVLPVMMKLKELRLPSNALKLVPALRSTSLKTLILSNNEIGTLQPGWSLPNLEFLDIRGNPILTFPSQVVDGMMNLMVLAATNCNLGPVLSSGSLVFHSRSLRMVFLQDNNIVKVEPGAISGLRGDTKIYLLQNNITTLMEDSFRPMVEVASMGHGEIFVNDNPLKCEVSMAWLVLSPDVEQVLQKVIFFECLDGTSLLDLLLIRFLHLLLPFQWVYTMV
ncbi:unnamed protein product [Darwinula stevensoni]|uniref:Uncharacterized protein n=1 Tax=Darwinula stevensoni TaxID=69355 RepID=A0A7R9FRU9_9CRUS|nr:unnamed protein product [Darwinula stevensoni]CAG0902435.1 unnamed protein product [Darwinula stevensoni]